MNVIVLEDSSERIKAFREAYRGSEIIFTKTPKQTISALKRLPCDLLYLDHDLGDKAGTGLDVVNFLCNDKSVFRGTYIIIHSWNVVASRVMADALIKADYSVVLWRFNPKNILFW